MTILAYNGVVLRDCETKSFEQTVVYDDSNTDVIFSRFKIRVASTVVSSMYPNTQFGIASVDVTSTMAQRMHDVQNRLSESRGDFWFLVDHCTTLENDPVNATILDQPMLIATGTIGTPGSKLRAHPFSVNAATAEYGVGGGTADIDPITVLDPDNGPKPKHLSVTQIFGGRAMRVEFEIEVCRKLCKSDFMDQEPAVDGIIVSDNRILSNRWSLEESQDENWITTKVIQGTLRVAHSSYWPHAMRLLCIPSLLSSYQRVRQSFVSDPTDTVLKYRIEDRQGHAAPPPPAVSWSGHHTEAASGTDGIIKTGEVSVRLTGMRGVDKQLLISTAGKVIVNRIRGLSNLYPDQYSVILQNASIVDILHEPTIEMRVQVKYTEVGFKALALRIKAMGSSLNDLNDPTAGPYNIDGYNPSAFPVPIPYDSLTPAGLFNCYLQHPCSIWHDIPNAPTPGGGSGSAPATPLPPESTYPPSKTITPVTSYEYPEQTELVVDETGLSEEDDIYKFPYTFVEIENRYSNSNGWVSMPIASNDEDDEKTSELIKLHARSSTRILLLTATREGKLPTLPSLEEEIVDHNGNREVLAYFDVISKAPQLLANGRGRRFQLQAEYRYLLEKAPSNSGILRGSALPQDALGPEDATIDLAATQDILGRIQWSSPS